MRQLDSIDPIEAGKEFERHRAERDECNAKLCDRIAILEQELVEAKAERDSLLERLRIDRNFIADIAHRAGEHIHDVMLGAAAHLPQPGTALEVLKTVRT